MLHFFDTLSSPQWGAFFNPFFKISPNKYKLVFAFKTPRISDLPAREGVGAELQEKNF